MMHLITGRQGTDHVTSANEGFKNSKIFGEGNIIFDAQGDFYARKIDDNTIRVSKGQGMMNGRAFENLEDTDLTIMTGTVALKRIDLICVRYEKNPNTELEKVELVVITGQKSVSEPTAPQYNAGNILNGDRIVDFPLYEVYINGLTIDSVTALFELHSGLVDDMRADVEGLKSKVGTSELTTDADDLCGAVNEIDARFNDMFVTARCYFPADVVASPNSSPNQFNIPCSKAGYTAIAIVGVVMNNYRTLPFRWYFSSDKRYVVFRFVNTSDQTLTVPANNNFVEVLYMKNVDEASVQILEDFVNTSKK